MTKKRLINKMPAKFIELAEPTPLTGSIINRIISINALHLTEISMALGLNTAALYSKKARSQHLKSSVSILMRLYGAFPEKLPRIESPTAEELALKIQKIDPDFTPSYSIGPLLGLETNSSYRLTKKGFSKSAQTTRVLAWLINDLLDEDPENWWIIKDTVETEAKARQIYPPSDVWKNGGWSKNQPESVEASVNNAPETPGATENANPTNNNAFKPLRRRSDSQFTTPESAKREPD